MRREPSHDRRVACTEVLIMRGGRRRGEDGNGGKCRGTRRAVPRSAPPRPVPAPPAASSPLPAPSPSLPLPPPFAPLDTTSLADGERKQSRALCRRCRPSAARCPPSGWETRVGGGCGPGVRRSAKLSPRSARAAAAPSRPLPRGTGRTAGPRPGPGPGGGRGGCGPGQWGRGWVREVKVHRRGRLAAAAAADGWS